MSPLLLIAAGLIGAVIGYGIAAVYFMASDADRCRTCLDTDKANSWSTTVLGLEFLGFTAVSPSLIVDLAREALARTPEEAPACE